MMQMGFCWLAASLLLEQWFSEMIPVLKNDGRHLLWLTASLQLKEWFPELMQVPKTDGCYLLISLGCPTEVEQQDCDHDGLENGDNFLLMSGEGKPSIWVGAGTPKVFYYSNDWKRLLGNVMQMARVMIPK